MHTPHTHVKDGERSKVALGWQHFFSSNLCNKEKPGGRIRSLEWGQRAYAWVLCSHSLMKTEGEPKVFRGVRAVKAEQEAVLVQRIDRRSFWQDASGMKYKEQ